MYHFDLISHFAGYRTKLIKVPAVATAFVEMSGKGSSAPDGVEMTQQQIDVVLDIMRDNMNKVLDRDDKLSDLEERSDHLDSEAQRFGDQTKGIKKKYWWKDKKMLIIAMVVFVIIIGVILIASLV